MTLAAIVQLIELLGKTRIGHFERGSLLSTKSRKNIFYCKIMSVYPTHNFYMKYVYNIYIAKN